MLKPIKFEDIVVKEVKFSFEDIVAIETAAETDAVVRAFMKVQDLSANVNMSDPRVVEGLNMLIAKGITHER